jgi:hypothetical protein
MVLATFLFYVTVSGHGFSEVKAVPMPNANICEQVKSHMINVVANEKMPSPFSPDYGNKVMAPFKPECKTFTDTTKS